MGDADRTSDYNPNRTRNLPAPESYTDVPGTMIGPYKVLQVLGEGGFGLVYLAEQREPVIRRVGLKVIKPGMDSREVLARFEAERQALAMMDHPNVAMFFDSGISDKGRPYFAMEYVPGVPLTQYCDDNKLTTRERLEMLVKVCQAVHHAHQKGIIHRDLKPSNILVMLQDGKSTPKVIDFGVAKAISARLTERTLFTETGRLLGTPEYMSPEQAGTTGLDIDTRTDVYSLGVVMYQLLVGQLPFDPKSLRAAGYDGIMKIIREQDPPRLSTRLSSLGDTAGEMAERRSSDTRTLERQLRGDLDYITMHAMEKDRTRRYGSALEMAQDLERFLTSQPIVARPPSVSYKARKFVVRHRFGVGAVAAVTTAFLIGGVLAVIGFVRADAAAIEARKQRDLADAQRMIAQGEAAKFKRINDYLGDILRLGGGPMRNIGENVTVREMLDQAERLLKFRPPQDPEVGATLRNALGRSFLALGEYPKARDYLRESLDARKRIHSGDHADTADTLNGLGLSQVLLSQFTDAQSTLNEALEMSSRLFGPQSEQAADALNNLGMLASAQGKSQEAADLLDRSLKARRSVNGYSTTEAAMTLMNLGAAQYGVGKPDQAEKALREAMEIQKTALGKDSPDVARSLNNLAMTLREQNKLSDAEAMMREALAIDTAVLGENHPTTLDDLGNLGLMLQGQERFDEAEGFYRKALGAARALELPDLDIPLLNVAMVLLEKGQAVEAEPLAREAVIVARRRLPEGHPQLGFPLLALSRIAIQNNKAAEAEGLLRETMKIWDAGLPPEDWNHAQVRNVLGGCLTKLGQLDNAEPLLIPSFEKIKAAKGETHRRTLQAAQRVADYYTAKGQPDKAEAFRRISSALK
jgi:serine/threonine protein kinase/tetratricopeptide (TPR) repeat protein